MLLLKRSNLIMVPNVEAKYLKLKQIHFLHVCSHLVFLLNLVVVLAYELFSFLISVQELASIWHYFRC